MFCVVAVWGSTFVLIKGALADATPAAFNLVRMSLAFVLLAVAYHRSLRAMRRSHLAAGALVGLMPRRRLSVPDHRPGPHHALQIRVHHWPGRCPGAAVLGYSCPASAGSAPSSLECLLGAALAFTGILLLTSPTCHAGSGTPQCWRESPHSCPISLPSTAATCSPSAAPSALPSIASHSATSRLASRSSRWRCCRLAFAPSSWP